MFVGEPPATDVAPAFARPVGARLLAPPSLGQLLVPDVANTPVSIRLLGSAAPQPVTVSFETSDDLVASVVETSVEIPVSGTDASFTIAGNTPGSATLTLRFGNEVRELTVVVGDPLPSEMPAIVAPPVRVDVPE